MKAFTWIVILVATVGGAVFLNRGVAPISKPETSFVPQYKESGPIPKVALAQPPNLRLAHITRKLTELSSQLKETDQRLEAMGFPKVFADERLGDEERQRLLDNLRRATELQIQIANLSVQKINLETGDAL